VIAVSDAADCDRSSSPDWYVAPPTSIDVQPAATSNIIPVYSILTRHPPLRVLIVPSIG
jgi:hypothetical protein